MAVSFTLDQYAPSSYFAAPAFGAFLAGRLLGLAVDDFSSGLGSDEVAALALCLCSDEAGFITGCDYPMDGGFIKLNN